MKVYHGSSEEIVTPDIGRSRLDIDFGVGFYMTDDKHMASKWACNKFNSVLNAYDLDLSNLRVKKLNLDEEWLHYVIANRTGNRTDFEVFDDQAYDVIIGATADDKLFNIIDMYNDGFISTENAIKIMNCMNYSQQIVLKTDHAIKQLRFLESHPFYGLEKQQLQKSFANDRAEANKRTRDMLREINGR